MQRSEKIEALFNSLMEMLGEEVIIDDDIVPFIEHFTWRDIRQAHPTPADDCYWLQDNDYESSLTMMSDTFEAGLRLGQKAAGRPVIFIPLSFGGIHGEESQLFLFGDEDEWLAKLKVEFDRRFIVAQTMAS